MSDSEDVTRLQELGYQQELRRDLGALGSIALGFATISPVVGLYAVVMVGMTVAGPSWVWVLPVCLIGQCLIVAVYAELAADFPVAGGAYQWARRLIGPRYGWHIGWLGVWSYLAANTTIAYLAAPWACTLLGLRVTAGTLVAVAAGFIVVCSIVNTFGVGTLRSLVSAGIAAEAVASVIIGLALLLVFRTQSPWLLLETLGAEQLSGGSVTAGLMAALAVGGWAFLGFDSCVQTSEETHRAHRSVPRAVWWSLLSVGALVLLNAFAVTLAHPDPARVVAGHDLDPVTTAVVAGFGSWSAKPFVAVVLVSFVACGLAAQGASARAVYGMARDGALPWSRFLRTVSGAHQSPVGGTVAVTVVGVAGLMLAWNSVAIGSLITFGTAVIYLVFFLIAVAALVARVRGTWVPRRASPGATARRPAWLGVAGLVNLLAVLWQGFEFVNVAWPRPALAPPGAPWIQVWASPLLAAGVTLIGVAYLALARPHHRSAAPTQAPPVTAQPAPDLVHEELSVEHKPGPVSAPIGDPVELP